MHELDPSFQSAILDATSAAGLEVDCVIQSLWSGYGQILRVRLEGGSRDTVVVKHVRFPVESDHPRGWNSYVSHQRKVKSYEVETDWYGNWSRRCGDACRIPECLALERKGDEVLIILEDLDAAGFPGRLGRAEWSQVRLCLRWLANFHATFIGESPEGLWETGTYWHLETRPDELQVLEDRKLKAAAVAIDERLKSASFQTLVHGDAKLANFCFSGDASAVAAVDFQYVGGGCGMKDVAYFVGSCMGERECEEREAELLDEYFSALVEALEGTQIDTGALVAEWRELYPVAWTDFHRFLKGWSPGHWKINSYSERLAREVVASMET